MTFAFHLRLEKPSLAAGIVFNIGDDSMFVAIRLLLTSSLNAENDEDIKKVVVTLCSWLRQFNGFPNIQKCIIKMLSSLEVNIHRNRSSEQRCC